MLCARRVCVRWTNRDECGTWIIHGLDYSWFEWRPLGMSPVEVCVQLVERPQRPVRSEQCKQMHSRLVSVYTEAKGACVHYTQQNRTHERERTHITHITPNGTPVGCNSCLGGGVAAFARVRRDPRK